MKGIIYAILVIVPSLIIGVTVYATELWSASKSVTLISWFTAMTGSMVLVTILYLKLMPLVTKEPSDETDENSQSSD